jgi:predicted nucleotidyltransferase
MPGEKAHAAPSSYVDPGIGEVLDEAVRRIVEVAHPRRVILFGSAARGEMGPDSDMDLLVVVERPVHRRKLAQKIHHEFFGLGTAIDVVVVTEDDVRHGVVASGTVLASALTEGRVLHVA